MTPSCWNRRRAAWGGPSLGLTLLEVMLAIAILGGALAVIGEIIRIGARASEEAREITTAQIYCETKMTEVVTGITPLAVVSRAPFEADPNWLYSILVQPVQQEGLVAVQVTVEQNLPPGERAISFSLVRWMMDPLLEYEEMSGGGTADAGTANDTYAYSLAGGVGG